MLLCTGAGSRIFHRPGIDRAGLALLAERANLESAFQPNSPSPKSTMKMIRSFNLWLMAACACLSVNLAQGLTIPASEDTSSSLGSQQNFLLTAKAGSATTLDASSKETAFIRFEAGSYADVEPAISVEKAWLMIYVADVIKPGALRVHTVTQDWTETVTGKPAAPTFQAQPIATLPTESVKAKQFLLVDVTGQVKNWLTTPDSDFGFAIASDGTAKVKLGSKDGPAKGYAAVLQIEKKIPTNTPEDLRIIRGTVSLQNGVLTVTAGAGFTISQLSGPTNKDFTITFTQPFSAAPSITGTVENEARQLPATVLSNTTASGTTVIDLGLVQTTKYHFIAVGPR